MSKPLGTQGKQWANRALYGINELEPYLAAADALQCFGNLAQLLVNGGVSVCKLNGPYRFTTHIDIEDPSLEPKKYQRGEEKIPELLFKYKLLPKALKPIMDEDPRALMTLVGLSPLRKWTVAKRLGRMLEEENAMNSQNFPSKLTVPSGSPSKKATKDTKTIQKWWKKAQPKSSRKGRTSFDRRADLDDEEGVGLIVAYIVRQAFGDLLDFLDDDPSYGLDPDEDDVPRNFVSDTTKWKKYPAIFKGDAPVRVQEADFYTARRILYPSDDDED
ncbi:hypothetical protein CEP54_014741 [Fusarium duplospermum]|uniref:Uncharacterized protein n=1 Tax=Fusarium duplospermum TaxID=1325734 RepID=A0A428NU82_9HYPO|nr:hypothetical protein CEP54_014741 [Fusarium duplospermum]